MLIRPLIISIFVGFLISEIALRVFAARWPRVRLYEIVVLLRAFHYADGDDERQALMLRTGRATLILSSLGFGLFAGLVAIAWLPPWALEWVASQQLVYFLALSVVATLWYFIRRSRNSVGHAK